MRIRVMHVASGDLWAGAEVQIYHLLRAMIQMREITLMAMLMNDGELASRLRDIGVPVTILNENLLSSAQIFKRLINVFRSAKPDVIHTLRTKENILASLAAVIVRSGVSLRTAHGSPEYTSARSKLTATLDRMIGRYVQKKIVAVSTDLAERLRKYFHSKNVTCVPNGIDLNYVREQAAQPTAPISNAKTRVCFVGRMVPVKRVDVFLAAAKELVQRQPDAFRFYVIGDGRPLLTIQQQQARALGVADHVEFLGFHANCLPILKQMDLVLTSDHEGLPMVALEALSLGIPVVSHAVGGLPELIDMPQRGRTVYSQNPQAFAEAIESIGKLQNAERSSLLPPRHTADAGAAQYVQLYREVLGEVPARQ